MRYYVTLFDSNYLVRGLVMYRSLKRHSEHFHLWVICFDDLAYQVLNQLNLNKVTLVPLSQFEDEELLKIKPTRTPKEYCWTCTPSTLLYVFKTAPYVDSVTYLDADLMFFSSPESIFVEAGDRASILLTEHRYIPELQHETATRGIYNVQFLMFRRNSEGLAALNWWRDRCLEWCFDRMEDNKFGDQKYLDDWCDRFTGVYVVQQLGAGLAPWNANQYSIQRHDSQIYVEGELLIFYHFHGLSLYWLLRFGYVRGGYPISHALRELIYRPYLQDIAAAFRDSSVLSSGPKSSSNGFPKIHRSFTALNRLLRFVIREVYQAQFSTRFFRLPL